MASRLDSFPQGHGLRYDEEWFDGSPWRLVRGEDFDKSAPAMRSSLATVAKRRGQRLKTLVLREGDAEILVIQALDAASP